MVVIKKISVLFLFLFYFISNISIASEILDFESELFIETIIDEIKETNNINKKFDYKIIKNKNINAFVDNTNTIHITSGLIENCSDYIAFLAVIAHEIGHIDKNHIVQRKLVIKNLKNINTISNLSIIAGSLISNNPEVIQSVALSSASSSNYYINFSKDQEREADIYSIETLKKLNLYSSSVIELLETIENQGKKRGLDEEMLKTSTHPYFEERIEIIKFLNKNNINSLDKEKNRNFKYIQAKFLGYSNNITKVSELDDIYKLYANSIIEAKKGNLKESMTKLNKLITIEKNNIFLLETKADILFSYGYIKESIDFYEQVIRELPKNYYAKIRVFENTNIEKLSIKEANDLFFNNINLLTNFYNNKNVLIKYIELSKFNNKNEWTNFLNYWLTKKDNLDEIKNNLIEFKKTKDKKLYNFIDIIYNDLS